MVSRPVSQGVVQTAAFIDASFLDEQCGLGEVHVLPLQPAEFAAAQAGVASEEDQAAFLCASRLGEQPTDFCLGVELPGFPGLFGQAGRCEGQQRIESLRNRPQFSQGFVETFESRVESAGVTGGEGLPGFQVRREKIGLRMQDVGLAGVGVFEVTFEGVAVVALRQGVLWQVGGEVCPGSVQVVRLECGSEFISGRHTYRMI